MELWPAPNAVLSNGKDLSRTVGVASALTVLSGPLVVIVPGIGIGFMVVQQSSGLVEGASHLYRDICKDVDGVSRGILRKQALRSGKWYD